MTPENVGAQEAALEALVAASLRCPDKLPDITEREIRRFVEQKVTLRAEDEAALAKSKPGLFKSIEKILGHHDQEHSVSDSRCSETNEHRIPVSLATFAARQQLPSRQVRQLLGMRLQLLGHRGAPGSDDLEKFNWERFYNKVKEYLK